MTYNVFALCGHWRFRDSNGFPMIHFRYPILTHEIGTYRPDIVCLQEIDRRETRKLQERLGMLGYSMVFLYHNTVNTMAVCYRNNLFSEVRQEQSYYSVLTSNDLAGNDHGRHCVMMMCLSFNEDFLEGHSQPLRNGLIIVNTHLPCGEHQSKSRTRQTAALMKSIKEFSESLGAENGYSDCYTFLAGDFNSGPSSSAYQSLVSKPFEFSPDTNWDSSIQAKIEQAHNRIDLRATSLYSVGYHLVNLRNSGIDNDRNEPPFSFWGPDNRGLLDYIFVICRWSGDDKKGVDTLEELSEAGDVKLLGLLRMPRAEEMYGSIPQVGMYPSDHLCMMADLELL
ncbi:Endonuclease/exonuclease/phosphatase [Metschnikowia bicuspidata var. bicuspidata NRRL YB-4993]|uniref:Endonuclease/exonuclease/phosphatase n=1 Tax=Metschnikowia bicuspidata var. bicuspidata NRRL YB-4993 TaxID=869754 RepID=A0A1A0H9F6_9ASCO|nr:Endonuclease/exonuclease/phosphatase [Metschnikowia bicuspidata var. bicuspidata NRRL YB-4993]OBA20625.1 Endonuclease/exonuclease/phosphatase [Metschnikowia bicuspidata var. bicuspidata NRRL YB-4993]